ncbi:hypothetical protein C8F01DRAFT_1379375 [Mycena amicta]|nr:hypothetical protein C8F01DRAFT_1379375 [Mycena amicta]
MITQTQDLDIWQIHTGDEPYVDVYTPPLAAFLPSTLLDVPHTSSNVTPTTPLQQDLTLTRSHEGLRSCFRRAWSLLQLGHTAEGREMLGLRVSKPSNATKLGFMVMGPQHAREWVATATALYFAHAQLVNASEPNSLASLLDVYDFYIIPSLNPDGYVYTWSTDRFWNWGFKWKPHSQTPFFSESGDIKKKKKDKTPADPCSHWYPGHRAFEAAEVTNVANYLTKILINGVGKGGIVAFVDLRSYGQMLAAPYSYKCDKLPKDAEDQIEALHGAAQAGLAIHGKGFSAGSLCELLYTAPGNILDYVYSTVLCVVMDVQDIISVATWSLYSSIIHAVLYTIYKCEKKERKTATALLDLVHDTVIALVLQSPASVVSRSRLQGKTRRRPPSLSLLASPMQRQLRVLGRVLALVILRRIRY